MTLSSKTCLVLPCYNEEKRLKIKEIELFLSTSSHVDLLFVNDGSLDSTLSILKELEVKQGNRVQVLSLPQNKGKAEAVRLGVLQAAQRDYGRIGYWDSDLATPFSCLNHFLELLMAKADIQLVMGCRLARLGAEIHRKTFRHYIGRVFATFIAVLLGVRVYDTQCGAKVFRKSDQMIRCFENQFYSKWLFDVEILARMKAQSIVLETAVFEYPLEKWDDVGESKLKMRDGFKAALDLARMFLRY